MPASPFHRILIGWDGSPGAQVALQTGLRLAGTDGRVVALAVIPSAQHTETEGERQRALAASREVVERRFAIEQERHGSRGAEVSLDIVESSHVADVLHRHAAERGFDLVIVGRHGEGGALHPKLGHIAEAAVRHGPVPVLLVSPPDAQG